MSKEFTIDDIKALDNFKKLSKLGWSIVSTKRQLNNKTIVLDHKLFKDISTVVFFKYPYIVDGYSGDTFDGKSLKYTRRQQDLKRYSTKNLSEKDYFIKAFDFFINTYRHDKKFLIKKELYDTRVKITKSDKLFTFTYGHDYWNMYDEVFAKLSPSNHMLEFDNDFKDLEISSYKVSKKLPYESAKVLHISMKDFNELSRFYDNIIYKKKNIRLSNYETAREGAGGTYSETIMKRILQEFREYESSFGRKIKGISEVVNSHSNVPVNYHKRNITRPDDLWKIVDKKMKGYKEHLSNINTYTDYLFFKDILNVLDIKVNGDMRVMQAGEQFGFFEKD